MIDPAKKISKPQRKRASNLYAILCNRKIVFIGTSRCDQNDIEKNVMTFWSKANPEVSNTARIIRDIGIDNIDVELIDSYYNDKERFEITRNYIIERSFYCKESLESIKKNMSYLRDKIV